MGGGGVGKVARVPKNRNTCEISCEELNEKNEMGKKGRMGPTGRRDRKGKETLTSGWTKHLRKRGCYG